MSNNHRVWNYNRWMKYAEHSNTLKKNLYNRLNNSNLDLFKKSKIYGKHEVSHPNQYLTNQTARNKWKKNNMAHEAYKKKLYASPAAKKWWWQRRRV